MSRKKSYYNQHSRSDIDDIIIRPTVAIDNASTAASRDANKKTMTSTSSSSNMPPSFNIFDELRKNHSPLMNLYEDKEILNVGAQAPAPQKDYCHLTVLQDKVIFRQWKITHRSDSENRYPIEIKDSYYDFIVDDHLQYEIGRIFGKPTLEYIVNIVEGKLDYLSRMPQKVLLKVVTSLDVDDVARLAQVNKVFRDICRSDKVWMELYKKNNSHEIQKDLLKVAEKEGWRKVFFTNKIELRVKTGRARKELAEYNELSGAMNLSPRSRHDGNGRIPTLPAPIKDKQQRSNANFFKTVAAMPRHRMASFEYDEHGLEDTYKQSSYITQD